MDPKELLGQAQLLFVEGKENESIKTFTKAIESFNRAEEANSNNPRTYYYRGLAFMDNEEFERAVSDLSKARGLKPDLYTARFACATAYARLDKFNEAVTNLRDVLPQMEVSMKSFADSYGIVRTEMFKVLA